MQEIYVTINNNKLKITLADNSSVKALVEKLKEKNITIDMSDYSNFEKVGDLGFNLPTNDTSTNTVCGDVILYQGNKFVIYYDKNSWSFTKIGKIEDISQNELKSILGKGNVIVTLSIN